MWILTKHSLTWFIGKQAIYYLAYVYAYACMHTHIRFAYTVTHKYTARIWFTVA